MQAKLVEVTSAVIDWLGCFALVNSRNRKVVTLEDLCIMAKIDGAGTKSEPRTMQLYGLVEVSSLY